jgi:hypothetical protein
MERCPRVNVPQHLLAQQLGDLEPLKNECLSKIRCAWHELQSGWTACIMLQLTDNQNPSDQQDLGTWTDCKM